MTPFDNATMVRAASEDLGLAGSSQLTRFVANGAARQLVAAIRQATGEIADLHQQPMTLESDSRFTELEGRLAAYRIQLRAAVAQWLEVADLGGLL